MATLKKKYKPKQQNVVKLQEYINKLNNKLEKNYCYNMSFGAIYPVSYWGNTNEANGWGIIYPFNADGSLFTADTTKETADTTQFTADATEF